MSFMRGLFAGLCSISITEDVMHLLGMPPYDKVTMLGSWMPSHISGPIATIGLVYIVIEQARSKQE